MVKPERLLQEETGKKVPVIPENVGKEASKLKKGETQRASLDLFKENKSITEIARIRGLAITTIENHLASFVKTGEIDIHKLVAQEKIGTILDAIRELGETRLSPVKNKLGAAFSYLEIKAVVCCLERESLIVSLEDAGKIISTGKPDVLAES
jgi:uncharacterized protein YpbB